MKQGQLKILLADDEERMRRLLCDYLRREGYTPVEAPDGKKALDLFFDNPDTALVVLDVMMPHMDGWSVCREIRRTSKVPVIMLTARGEESDEIFGFDLGADEYIRKPFSPGVLIARIKALLRRSTDDQSGKLVFGSLVIDTGRHAASVDGTELELSPKEYELLTFLAYNAGTALSRDRILNHVWDPNYFGDGRTVDTHIKRLREKMGASAELIETVRGFGYRFEDQL